MTHGTKLFIPGVSAHTEIVRPSGDLVTPYRAVPLTTAGGYHGQAQRVRVQGLHPNNTFQALVTVWFKNGFIVRLNYAEYAGALKHLESLVQRSPERWDCETILEPFDDR